MNRLETSAKNSGHVATRGVQLGAIAFMALGSAGCGQAAAVDGDANLGTTAQAVGVQFIKNGWKDGWSSACSAPCRAAYTHHLGFEWYATTATGVSSGVMRFSGTVYGGSSNVIFNLNDQIWNGQSEIPVPPDHDMYLPIDLCGGRNGRLIISATTGDVSVQAENNFSDAQCFTSLEGVSFVPSGAGFLPLTLQNNWATYGNATPQVAVLAEDGAVHFRGAIRSGSSGLAFTLPPSVPRPTTAVYLNVDLCNATKGRLMIDTSGNATVVAEGGIFSHAQCFTSLDGAWYLPTASVVPPGTLGFKPVSLINGWSGAPYGTDMPSTVDIDGNIMFKGAIGGGSASQAFDVFSDWAPFYDIYLPLDLCDGAKGRLHIYGSPQGSAQQPPPGRAEVLDENGGISHASCFTSLEGQYYPLLPYNFGDEP